MGRNSSLKKIRKYSTSEIDEVLKQLDEKDLDNNKVFEICGKALKLNEVHFKIGRKDNKMYNKYKKQIDELLHNRIYFLGLVKDKDRKLTVKTLLKKDYDFLYVLLMTEFQLIAQVYETLRKNIPYGWLKFENGTVLPELNMDSSIVKNNTQKILNHLNNLYTSLNKEEITLGIRTKERYTEYQKIIKEKLSELENNKSSETFEQSFYRYSFEELDYLYSDILIIEEYVRSYMDVLSKLNESTKE